jgi:hypothetical protein
MEDCGITEWRIVELQNTNMTNQDINQRKISMTMKFRPLLIKKTSQILVSSFGTQGYSILDTRSLFKKIKLLALHKYLKNLQKSCKPRAFDNTCQPEDIVFEPTKREKFSSLY